MARPMNPLHATPKNPLTVFAEDLRATRIRAGSPSLERMAQISGVSTASLSKAHSGVKRPTWRSVQGYLTACGQDPAPWKRRWQELRLLQSAPVTDHDSLCRTAVEQWAKTGVVTPPSGITTQAELRSVLKALLHLYELSIRQLAMRRDIYCADTYASALRGRAVSHLPSFTSSSWAAGCGPAAA